VSDDHPVDELIRLGLDDRGVATITIDRPEAKNALTQPMRDHLGDLFEQLSTDLRVRVVVLRGTGDSFCAGADLRSAGERPPRPDGAPSPAAGEIARMIQEGWQRLVTTIQDCNKPVIGQVNGVAAGGGFQLAVACDLVLAAESARFVQAFVHRGIVPDAGAAYLVTRIVGPQQAKELFFLGEKVAATDAHRIGLVNRVVPDDELDKAVDELAGRLAVLPTTSIATSKRLINKAYESDRATALWDEAIGQEVLMQTHDAKEGVAAFRERRDPDFKGY
jgi:2-(1,2-epoxy-1,2-dihydrophenyl)acetyl-CoA isomerase